MAPSLIFAETLTITSLQKTKYPYTLRLGIEENYAKVEIDCHSFIHGIFLYDTTTQFRVHEMDEESCSDLVEEINNYLDVNMPIMIRLIDSPPYYQILWELAEKKLPCKWTFSDLQGSLS